MQGMRTTALRIRRLKRRLRLKDVADRAGVSVASLSAWERGDRTPKEANLKAWRKALAKLEKEGV